MTRAELKSNAKSQLKGKWGVTIAVYLLYMIIPLVLDMIIRIPALTGAIEGMTVSVLASLAMGILVYPALTVALLRYQFDLFEGKEASVSILGYGFKNLNLSLKFFGASFMVVLFTFLWSLLLIVPGIIKAFSYSQTLYLIVDNPDMGIFEAINKSKELMRGRKMDLFILSLSFIGWWLLGILTFGILYIWLTPYISQTMTNFYKTLVGQTSPVGEPAPNTSAEGSFN